MLHSIKSYIAVAALGLAVIGPAQAFRSTDFESFTDPDYAGFLRRTAHRAVSALENER